MPAGCAGIENVRTPSRNEALLRLLVARVLAAPRAMLRELQPLLHLPLVLLRVIVDALAINALEFDEIIL